MRNMASSGYPFCFLDIFSPDCSLLFRLHRFPYSLPPKSLSLQSQQSTALSNISHDTAISHAYSMHAKFSFTLFARDALDACFGRSDSVRRCTDERICPRGSSPLSHLRQRFADSTLLSGSHSCQGSGARNAGDGAPWIHLPKGIG